MRIAVFSDTHGVTETMLKIIKALTPDAVFHLGDYVRDVKAAEAAFPDIPFYAVRGNNDAHFDAPRELCFELHGIQFFLTHGHEYGVRSGTERLSYAAEERGAEIALYGHTHRSEKIKYGDITVVNPGSLTLPYPGESGSYAVIEIESGRAEACIIHV